MKRFYYLAMVITFLALACAPRSEMRWATSSDVKSELRDSKESGSCQDWADYVPDTNYLDFYPIRHIRVNFHYMNNENGDQNYTGEEALKYTKTMLWEANKSLAANRAMYLPRGQNNPVYPLRFKYVLTPAAKNKEDTGVYSHFDDDLYYMITLGKNRNNYNRDVLRKYEIGSDTILNIFIMPHHPDSVASPTYSAVGSGIALGNCIKMTGLVENNTPAWGAKGLLNHEVGHVFGLRHTWRYNDGCDDTPRHPGCWNKSDKPPCDTMFSNNVMDYNAFQNAWTPCQIGKVREAMGDHKSSKRKLLRKDWCHLIEDDTISIKDSIHIKGMRDVKKHIRIEAGGTLHFSCAVAMAPGSSITVLNRGKLILENVRMYNACGMTWKGILIEDAGKDGKGEIIMLGDTRLEDLEYPTIVEPDIGS